MIRESNRERIQKYICGIVNQDRCKVIGIYPDHTHILAGLRPSIAISDLVRDIKSVSSKFINEQKLTGRMVMVHLPVLILKSLLFPTTSKNSRSIMKNKHFEKHIFVFWNNLKSNMMNNICLNGWISGTATRCTRGILAHLRALSRTAINSISAPRFFPTTFEGEPKIVFHINIVLAY